MYVDILYIFYRFILLFVLHNTHFVTYFWYTYIQQLDRILNYFIILIFDKMIVSYVSIEDEIVHVKSNIIICLFLYVHTTMCVWRDIRKKLLSVNIYLLFIIDYLCFFKEVDISWYNYVKDNIGNVRVCMYVYVWIQKITCFSLFFTKKSKIWIK